MASSLSEKAVDRKQRVIVRNALRRRLGHPQKYGKTQEDNRALYVNARALDMGIYGGITATDIRSHMEAQCGKCFWCGNDLGGVYQVDHLISLKRGGTNTTDNICVSCPSCNVRKMNKSPETFRAEILAQKPSATASREQEHESEAVA